MTVLEQITKLSVTFQPALTNSCHLLRTCRQAVLGGSIDFSPSQGDGGRQALHTTLSSF